MQQESYKLKLKDLSSFTDKIFSNYTETFNLLDNKYSYEAIELINRTRTLNTIYKKNYNIVKSWLLKKKIKDCVEVLAKVEKDNNKLFSNEKAIKNRLASLYKENIPLSSEDIYILNNLPLEWDWNSDLIVILGNNNINLIKKLKKQKQQRIWLIDNKNKFFEDKGLVVSKNIENINLDKFYHKPSNKIALWNFQNDNNYYKKIKKKLDILQSSFIANKKNISQFLDYWLINGLKNLDKLAYFKNISAIYNKFLKKECIFIGAGPSLDKNIKILKKFKNKYHICACLHSLGALKDNKIYPDFIIHTDPVKSPWLEDIVRDYDFSKVKFLILGATVTPCLFNINVKNIFWFNSNNYYDKWFANLFNKIEILEYPMSISIVAVQLLSKLGFNKIAFMGLDLADYANKYYASGAEHKSDHKRHTIGFKHNNEEKPSVIDIRGFYGKTIRTSSMYLKQLIYLEKTIKTLEERFTNIQFFNVTEGGAYISGSKHLPLLSFIENYKGSKNKLHFSKLLVYKHTFQKDKELTSKVKLYKNSFINDLINLNKIICIDVNLKNNIAKIENSKLEIINNFISKICNRYEIMNILFQDVFENLEEGYSFFSEDLNQLKTSSFYSVFTSKIKYYLKELNRN